MSYRDDELTREIRTHLELEAEERVAGGQSEDDARRDARRAFGSVARTREDVRAVWVPLWLDELQRDLRHTIAALARQRAFTVVTVLTLALGIGANTAIFSLMDQVLLRSLPVDAPETLVLLDSPGPYQGSTYSAVSFSAPMYWGLRDAAAPVFSDLLARFSTQVTLTVSGRAERGTAEVVSGNYFRALRIRTVIGRPLGVDDDRTPESHPVVVVSHAYWRSRFAADPSILDRTVTLNGRPMAIVGVAAPAFAGVDLGAPADVFVPMMMKRTVTPTRDDLVSWRSRWVSLIGRLQPGVTAEQAAVALNPTYRQLLSEDVKTTRLSSEAIRERFLSKPLTAAPGGKGLSSLRTSFSTVLLVLMGMVGLVLLIACANVANLLIARAAGRQREVAIRLALGAGRRRVIRQRLTETLLLAGAGAALGLLLASWTTRLLIDMLPFAGARTLSATPDIRILGFATALAILTALVAGLWPALAATVPALFTVLKEETAGRLGGGRQARVRKGVVIVQVGLSVVLLVGAGVFARSLRSLQTLAPGFATTSLLQFRLAPSSGGYTPERSIRVVGDLEERLRALPGVVGVTAATIPLLTGDRSRQTVRVPGYQSGPNEDMNPSPNTVDPGYFSTLGIPVVAGREFTAADGPDARKVAIVNETMARYFWPRQNPVGQRFGRQTSEPGDEYEVIGIVKDARESSLREPAPRAFYLPYTQAAALSTVTIYVRYRTSLESLAPAVRGAAQDVAAGLPVYDLRTLDAQLSQSLVSERLLAALSLAFATLATALAAVGLYGMMSFTVARRTRELGVRIALGATRGTVLAMVLREAAALVGLGLIVGLPIVLGLGRFLRAQVFGVAPTDAVAIGVALLVLGTVGLLASYLPARRATRISPLLALRDE